MIHRLYNPKILEAAVDEQSLEPVRDLSPAEWLINPNHVALTDGRNICLFEALETPGEFLGHIIFRDRGKAALEAVRKIVRTLKDLFGAKTIYGQPPVGHKAAAWFLRQIGFRFEGIRQTLAGPVQQFMLECA